MVDPDDPNVRAAVFGKEVEQFLETDIGKYLLAQAEEKATRAMQSLKNTAPWNKRRIQKLQNEIHTAEDFIEWLSQAVESGQQAFKLMEMNDE